MSENPERVRELFTDIYNQNRWHGEESRSGKGSGMVQTAYIRELLPRVFKNMGITSILDIPCGDMVWMAEVLKAPEMGNIHYMGADIVPALVETLSLQYPNMFFNLDILEKIPLNTDLIFCRDCLVHFSNADVIRAIRVICNTNSEYLMTTNFYRKGNQPDIETGRGWRPLNLCAKPFDFSIPERVIRENCPVEGFEDKGLALWKIASLKRELDRCRIK